jgi:hypothetical protein
MQADKYMLKAVTKTGENVHLDMMAIDAYEEDSPNSIIVHMNGGAVFELATSLKQMEAAHSRAGVPVIAL